MRSVPTSIPDRPGALGALWHTNGAFLRRLLAESPQGWVRIKGTLTCFLGAQQVSENNVCGVKTARSAAGGEKSENKTKTRVRSFCSTSTTSGALFTGETSQSKQAAPGGLDL